LENCYIGSKDADGLLEVEIPFSGIARNAILAQIVGNVC